MLLSFYHTCASKQHHVFIVESLSFRHFHILVGISIIELGLYIPMMGFLKLPQVFVTKRVGCCNTPDVIFHICNSNSCHFWLCAMIFLRGRVLFFVLHFVHVMHFISCHHVHCICIRVRLMHPSIFPVVRFCNPALPSPPAHPSCFLS